MIRYGLLVTLLLSLGYVAYDLGLRGAQAFERMQLQRINNALSALGFEWADIRADGLRIEVYGHAPDLFAQEMALETAQATAPFAVVTSYTTATLAPPERRDPVRFELHSDARGITMTGQTASRSMREELNAKLKEQSPRLEIRDLTGIQAAPPPDTWGPEIDVASLAASRLSDAYIVVEPGQVTISGGVPDANARTQLTEELLAHTGESLTLILDLSIPPRVIAPFVLSAQKAAGGGIRLEQCTARNFDEQAAIQGELIRAGIESRDNSCEVGLGGPSGDWPGAVSSAIRALAALPAGRVAVEYDAVYLVAAAPSPPAKFEAVLANLRTTLPEGYEATGELEADDLATLTKIRQQGYWLRITKDRSGITLVGKMPEGPSRRAVEVYAGATYVQSAVHSALTESADDAPEGWRAAVLDVLDELRTIPHGSAEFAGRRLVMRASLADPAHAVHLDRNLRDKLLGYDVETYLKVDVPEAVDAIPLPARPCAARLEKIVNGSPIDFDPGSAVITPGSATVLDALTAQLHKCTQAPIEIGGHTDSQGSEQLNLRISKARADAVRTSLIDRGIEYSRLRAVGYGESEPIADNSTEAGRARNRRITFDPAAPVPATEDN